MSCYLIVNATVTDPEKLVAYGKASGPTLAGHAVKPLIVTNSAETIEGEAAGPRIVVLEFPDRAALDAWYHSPEYQAVIGMRFESTQGFAVVAEGLNR